MPSGISRAARILPAIFLPSSGVSAGVAFNRKAIAYHVIVGNGRNKRILFRRIFTGRIFIGRIFAWRIFVGRFFTSIDDDGMTGVFLRVRRQPPVRSYSRPPSACDYPCY